MKGRGQSYSLTRDGGVAVKKGASTESVLSGEKALHEGEETVASAFTMDFLKTGEVLKESLHPQPTALISPSVRT